MAVPEEFWVYVDAAADGWATSISIVLMGLCGIRLYQRLNLPRRALAVPAQQDPPAPRGKRRRRRQLPAVAWGLALAVVSMPTVSAVSGLSLRGIFYIQGAAIILAFGMPSLAGLGEPTVVPMAPTGASRSSRAVTIRAVAQTTASVPSEDSQRTADAIRGAALRLVAAGGGTQVVATQDRGWTSSDLLEVLDPVLPGADRAGLLVSADKVPAGVQVTVVREARSPQPGAPVSQEARRRDRH